MTFYEADGNQCERTHFMRLVSREQAQRSNVCGNRTYAIVNLFDADFSSNPRNNIVVASVTNYD